MKEVAPLKNVLFLVVFDKLRGMFDDEEFLVSIAAPFDLKGGLILFSGNLTMISCRVVL